jgi:ferredoxin
MSTSIYYFTGTGNSLHAARTVAEQLGDSKVINIARSGPGIIEDPSDTVGIVFPVFYGNPPNIVKDFAARLKPAPNAYVFSIATCGGLAGNSLHTLSQILAKNGGRLSAGFTLVMPDNAYVGMNLVTPLEEREEALKESENELNKIIDALRKREHPGQKFSYSISGGIMGFGGSTFATHLYRLPKRFKATDKCTGCGICKKICPVGNITQVDKKVTWDNKCTHCLACFHWCPQTAIEIGGKSASIARYHHPAIKVGDLIK